MKATITFDIHDCDSVSNIAHCTEWLNKNNISATYFIHTSLLESAEKRLELHRAIDNGIQIGTHSHNHNIYEMLALINGSKESLSFLGESKKLYEDTFGFSPTAFRAPCWCHMSHIALTKLAELGYRIDCSSTPQRISLLSSFPYENNYFFSRRSVYENPQGLLVIPTSCFLVPLASPTFETFRKTVSGWFLALLKLEAKINNMVVLNIMFHVSDLNGSIKKTAWPKFQWEMLLLKKYGGFGFKYLLRETASEKIAVTTYSIIERLNNADLLTLDDIYRLYYKFYKPK